MTEHDFAVYNAFSDSPFGGCVAGIVDQASELNASEMLQIAQEVDAPATCFITAISQENIEVRFFSPLTEYPMCGHAAVALTTWLAERNLLAFDESDVVRIRLSTPHAFAEIEARKRKAGRVEVLLTLPPAKFSSVSVDDLELASVLGLDRGQLSNDLERVMTITDFRSLLVPMRNRRDLEAVVPDFDTIHSFCMRTHLDTVFLFAPTGDHWLDGIRCREFCPAVGSLESAASGTTNRSVSCYLYQHAQLTSVPDGSLSLSIFQGNEIGRPSNIKSVISFRDGNVNKVDIGGLATRVVNGTFFTPF